MERQIKETIKAIIEKADLVLVGIGEEFACKDAEVKAVSPYVEWMELAEREKERFGWLSPFLRKDFLDNNEDERTEKAYEALHSLLQNKNYFIVTENTDGRIFKSSLNPERIVAPCGNFTYLQCEDNCSQELMPAEAVVKEVLSVCRSSQKMPGQLTSPKCAHCGKNLVFNNVKAPSYEESSYLPMWEKYMMWLQGTLNKKVCILELGVGFSYPTIIRWPFEKIGFLNQKADFIRVHHNLYQLSEELKEKGISVEENAVDFLSSVL